MNRNARRAAKARARTTAVDRVTAIHEAGHAVGRLLTASAMGIPVEKAVFSIEIGNRSGTTIVNGGKTLRALATCYGPALSREMQEAYHAEYPGREAVSMDVLYARLAHLGTSEQRALAARSRVLMMAMGPAAEARELGKPFSDVIGSEGCLSDLNDIRKEATLIDGPKERVDKIVVELCVEAIRLVGTSDVWQAIDTIARNLKGNLPGPRIAELARPYIKFTNAAAAGSLDNTGRSAAGEPGRPQAFAASA